MRMVFNLELNNCVYVLFWSGY